MARFIRACAVLLTFGLVSIGIYLYYPTNRSDIIISDRISLFVDVVDQHTAKYKNKLIVLDLDDTIFMSSEILGTPTWYYNMVNLFRQSGAAKHEAFFVMSNIDKIVQEKINVVAVEQPTLNAIRRWQQLGATVVGLTSRRKDFARVTAKQLEQIELKFSSPFFPCIEEMWKPDEGGFVDGVLFVGDYLTKQGVFGQFFDKIKRCGMSIDLIAQADDQQRYVGELARFAKKNRVDFLGIIYGGALSSRNFDITEANNQLLNLESSLNFRIVPEEYRRVLNIEK